MNKIKLFLFISSSFVFLACGQNYNSQSADAYLGVADCSATPARVRFCAARTVILNQCSNCHTHQQWAAYQTDQAWIQSGRVVANNPGQSTLITKLQNEGGNMPLGYGPLSASDYNALKDWVSLMGQ